MDETAEGTGSTDARSAAAGEGAVQASAPLPPPDPGSRLAVEPASPPGRPRMPRRTLALVVVLASLCVLALAAVAVLALLYLRAEDRIADQEDRIDELDDLVDVKEEFGAAMERLMDTAEQFEGAPMASLVPFDAYEGLARQAWNDRHALERVGNHTAQADRYTEHLAGLLERAAAERAENRTGSYPEELLDEIGQGFASLVYGEADELCEDDVLGCVVDSEPYVVNLDRADLDHPAVDRWGRRYVTLHEFAHVLQFTNPEATAEAEKSFGGDWEFMADCYALNAMNSRSLERRVWVSAYEYWDTTYGYGRVCDSGQREVIDDWVEQSGVHYRAVSQETAGP